MMALCLALMVTSLVHVNVFELTSSDDSGPNELKLLLAFEDL